jgi:hypothetical protein
MGTVTFTVSNPTILSLLLTEVFGAIESEGDTDTLLEQGCDASFVDLVRRRPARDLMDVASRLKNLRFEVPVREIEQQFVRLDWMRRDTALCEYFVRHGASAQMITSLFKKSADEVRRMREALLPAGSTTTGRTALPKDPKVRDAIQQAWSDIQKSAGAQESLRDLLHRLHQRFSDHSIATLFSTIHEFEGDGGSGESAASRTLRTQHVRATT